MATATGRLVGSWEMADERLEAEVTSALSEMAPSGSVAALPLLRERTATVYPPRLKRWASAEPRPGPTPAIRASGLMADIAGELLEVFWFGESRTSTFMLIFLVAEEGDLKYR
jgi:hypothetical protein